MKCTNCGAELPEGSSVCFECGAAQQTQAQPQTPDATAQTTTTTTVNEPKKVKCSNCGAELPEGATVCFECGAPQKATVTNNANGTVQTNAVVKAKSKVLAAVLCFLWGAWGIDQFYLGYTKTGVTRIVVSIFTCCVGGLIWGVIDGFKILNGTINVDANGNPIL